MNKSIFFIFLFLIQLLPQKNLLAQDLKILCYNIHHANPPSKPNLIDLDAIARVITDSKADVVALQEVERGANRSGGVDEAKTLAEKTGMNYIFFKAIDFDGGEYGIAILSKFKLKDAKLVPLPQKVTAEKRALAYATIKVGKQRIVIANTHLDAIKTDENRIVQMESILKEFENSDLPIILAGDLNSVAGSEAINLLDKQFKRTCMENCLPTFPQINPRITIDYIATKNSKFSLLDYKVIEETYASDHRPISATFKIK